MKKPRRSGRTRRINLFAVAGAIIAAIGAWSLPLLAQRAQGWDTTFRAIPEAKKIGEYMKRMSARPHHLGSAYDKDNAEWILSKFKEWGWDARLETYDVLFPTPRERLVEMVAPSAFRLFRMSMTCSPFSVSRLPVGSSARIRAG